MDGSASTYTLGFGHFPIALAFNGLLALRQYGQTGPASNGELPQHPIDIQLVGTRCVSPGGPLPEQN
jgi:hypothetical protein